MNFAFVHGWDAIIAPVSFYKQTGKWNVLLGQNKDQTGTWSFFRKQGHGRGTAHTYAAQALKEQTNGFYDIGENQVKHTPSIRLSNKDVVHFVPVGKNFIAAGDLYTEVVKQRGGNQIKKDFAWLPIDDIIQNETITTHVRGRPRTYKFSQGTRRILVDHWNNVLQEIGKKAVNVAQADAAGPASSGSSGNTWLNIPGAIYFYNKGKNVYYEFTNFFHAPFTLDSITWPTSEHYYQAQKFYPDQQFEGKNIWRKINSIQEAGDVFDYVNPGLRRGPAHAIMQGRAGPKVRDDWKDISIAIMVKAVRAKFNQNSVLKNLLLSTHNAILVENAGKNDDFYGAGADGKGRNLLGQILMRIRDELSGAVDPREDFICYENPFDYFNKKNGKVCAQDTIQSLQNITKSSRGTKAKISQKAHSPKKKFEQGSLQLGRELELKLKSLRSTLRELLDALTSSKGALESIFLEKEEESSFEKKEEPATSYWGGWGGWL